MKSGIRNVSLATQLFRQYYYQNSGCRYIEWLLKMLGTGKKLRKFTKDKSHTARLPQPLGLADRSYAYPEGNIEDVLVKMDKFIFSVDFIVLDFEADKEVPIILGRHFLTMGKILIDVKKGELSHEGE